MAAPKPEGSVGRPAYARPAVIARMITALRASGFEPTTLDFLPDGTVRVSRMTTEEAPRSEFERWDARGAL